MTVQDLINALQEIQDKTLPVTIDAPTGYDSIENVEVDDLCECEKYGWITTNSRGNRKVILLME